MGSNHLKKWLSNQQEEALIALFFFGQRSLYYFEDYVNNQCKLKLEVRSSQKKKTRAKAKKSNRSQKDTLIQNFFSKLGIVKCPAQGELVIQPRIPDIRYIIFACSNTNTHHHGFFPMVSRRKSVSGHACQPFVMQSYRPYVCLTTI